MKDFPVSSPKNTTRLVRKKMEHPKVSSFKFILTWAILFLVALFFVQQRIDYTRTEKKVRQLMMEKRKIISSILPLQLEERYLTKLSNVENIARNSIYLRRPEPKQLIEITGKTAEKAP
ncbi:cell division protein FtsL [bacterium]|nr:cell division protein FtsL [bacterium]